MRSQGSRGSPAAGAAALPGAGARAGASAGAIAGLGLGLGLGAGASAGASAGAGVQDLGSGSRTSTRFGFKHFNVHQTMADLSIGFEYSKEEFLSGNKCQG